MAVQKVAPAPADAGAAFFVRIDHSVGASLITDQRPENPVIFLDPPGAGPTHMSNLSCDYYPDYYYKYKSYNPIPLTFFDMTYVFHFQIRHFIE
ncbi:hypothetical protein UY416_24235 [Paenibacillus polymyxa]|uniref:hypothetical protein n=1 Tax=Paenibacillus polymyxa TaxID=1406 RepID=UPI002AB5BF9B|nr:hypothetical protein [Paenibacillus polymyxa]MDY8049405.1 hypothetical protein [Paenibacillus polymyxa]